MKQISLRIEEELIKKTEELSELEHLERSVILRKALERGVEDLAKEAVVELYKKDEISLSEAANLSGLGAGELLKLLREHGVKSKITYEDFKRGEEATKELV